MTPEEVLFKNLLKVEGLTQEDIDEGKKSVVHLAIIASIEEFGNQMYNEAVNDCITNAKVVHQELSDADAYMVDTLVLENLKK